MLFPNLDIFCQSLDLIDARIDSLTSAKLDTEKRISILDAQWDIINGNLNILIHQKDSISLISENPDNIYVVAYEAIHKDKPFGAKAIDTIPLSSRVVHIKDTVSHGLSMSKIEYMGKVGWVWTSAVDELTKKMQHDEDEIQRQKEMEQARIQRHNSFVAQFGKEAAQKIIAGKIWLGMTKEMVIESWGKASEINRDVWSWGVNEQLVYGSNTYLYFENGILTSWQD